MPDRIAVHVLIPVKPLDRAKSRLRATLGDLASELALAFAVDVTRAALACPSTADVVVITDDSRVAEEVRAIGAGVIADAPGAGIDPALSFAAETMGQDRWRLALTADLPCLTAADLEALCHRITAGEVPTFVSDLSGIGTTAVAQPPRRRWESHFGPRSGARHHRAGLREIGPGVPVPVRRDVDTPVDLWDAQRIGVGPHTRALLDVST